MLGASRGNSVIAVTPAADYTDKRGYFVTVASTLVATIATAVTDIPQGVLIDGGDTDEQASVAMFTDPIPRKVKLGAAATAMSFGTLHATDGTVCDDPGSGGRVRVCLFLETGVAGELVDAILFYPVALS